MCVPKLSFELVVELYKLDIPAHLPDDVLRKFRAAETLIFNPKATMI